MNWRRVLQKKCLLYLILDQEVIKNNRLNIITLSKKLSSSEADIFQLRAKNLTEREIFQLANKLASIFHHKDKLFILDDHVDIAYLTGCDGVHLGRNDLGVKEARKILGKNRIIGFTTNSYREYLEGIFYDVDYLSFGPIFSTQTKPYLKPLGVSSINKISFKKPTFFIGGINKENISLFEGKNVCICRGVLLEKDQIKTIRYIKKSCLRRAS